MLLLLLLCGAARAQWSGAAVQGDTNNKAPRFHVLVGTPCFGGQVAAAYTLALLETQLVLMQHGIIMTTSFIPGQIVTRARNILAHGFLNDGNTYTHLLFIDADVVWQPADVLKLLSHQLGIVIGIYRIKAYRWDRLNTVTPRSHADAVHYLLDPASVLMPDAKPSAATGLMEIKFAATGFMLISREALLELAPHVETYAYPFMGNRAAVFHNFFDCAVVDNDYLTEDYHFSHLLRKNGQQIFADMRIQLKHIGPETYGTFEAPNFNQQETFDASTMQSMFAGRV